jgi:hypothetical protein
MAIERFRSNPAKIAHETIDGETILIHLETGFYYSVDGAGSEIWGGLAAGRSVDGIAGELEARYAAGHEELAAAVRRLAAEFVAESLLEPVLGEAVIEPSAAPTSNGDANVTKLEFAAPVLRKYTDMQDFLLVDPIHQTTDAGWPEARSEA